MGVLFIYSRHDLGLHGEGSELNIQESLKTEPWKMEFFNGGKCKRFSGGCNAYLKV